MACSIQRKLAMLFSSVFVVLLILFGSILFRSIANDTRDQLIFLATQSHQQAMTFLSSKVELSRYVADALYYDQNIQDFIGLSEQDVTDLGDEYREMSDIWTHLQNFESDLIDTVCLYINDKSTYADQGYNFESFDAFVQTDFYQQMLNSENAYMWGDPWMLTTSGNQTATRVVSMFHLIRSLSNFNQIIGVVQITLNAQGMDEVMANANVAKDGITFVVNANQHIVTASDMDLAQEFTLNGSLSDDPQVTIGQHQYIQIKTEVPQTDWYLITLIPTAAFYSVSLSSMKTLLACGIPILILGVLLVWLLSRSFGKRIRHLRHTMAAVQKGNLNVTMPETPPDELGYLGETFNYMLEEIHKLLQQQYENGMSLKQAELKFLQAQINPHFLYNTLDLINWKAMDNGVDEIAELTQILGSYYRLSLSKGTDFVALSSELKHLILYVKIQNYRFGNRIVLKNEVPEELLNIRILKLVLQPLVENSVQHGARWEDEDSILTITIKGKRDGDRIDISVEDDGIGVDAQILQDVLQKPFSEDAYGYGLRNIHLRLRLCYGEQYGLFFESENGTKVHLYIPANGQECI